MTFKEVYIKKHGLTSDDFVGHVLKRTLYWHARLLAFPIRFFDRTLLMADCDLLHDIGMLTSRRQFTEFVRPLRHHPASRRFVRKTLQLRMSVAKLHLIINETMVEAGSQSASPFKPSVSRTLVAGGRVARCAEDAEWSRTSAPIVCLSRAVRDC